MEARSAGPGASDMMQPEVARAGSSRVRFSGEHRGRCIAVLLLLTAFIYWNSFPGAFHFDDYPLLLENPHLEGPAFHYEDFLVQYGARPLTLWTFYWNHRLGGEDPAGYHLVNVLLHGGVAVEVFLLVLLLLGRWPLAFLSALLFALHPLQSQAVNYVWGRSLLLMALFALASLLAAKRRPWLSLLFFQLAVWSRAEALVLILPLLLWPRIARALGAQASPPWRGRQRVALLALGAADVAGILYFLGRHTFAGLAWNHPHPGAFWLSAPLVLSQTVRLMLWPFSLSVDHEMAPGQPALALLWLALEGLVVWGAWRCRKEFPEGLAALAWGLLMLSPSLLVPNADLFNESRAYLAMAGFCLALAAALLRLPKNWVPVLAGLLLLLLLPQTLERNRLWNDDLLLWQDAVLKAPGKSRAHYNLGVALTRAGREDAAQHEFGLALACNPENDLAWAALGYSAEGRGETRRARELYLQARRIRPGNRYAAQALARLGAASPRMRRGRKEPVRNRAEGS